jgi:hypothetical protein
MWHVVSDSDPRPTPKLFYTYFYNRAHRPRLEKLLYLELSRSSNGFFKPLLDPDGRFASETAARRFRRGQYATVSEAKRLQIYYGICSGHSPTEKSVRSGVTVM